MNKEKLENLIKNFSLEKLSDFLYDADLEEDREDFSGYNNEKIFQDIQKIGDIKTSDKKKVLVVAVKIKGDLSERTSRKKQYNLGKKILKKNIRYNAGIFVFYDKNGSFRFSLIYLTYSGTKAIPNSFRRYTYFVSPDPQITNKTFLNQIGDGDFSTLESIKKAFSVEKVTKEFYKDIANWYFWAVRESEFPKDVKAEENGKNIAIIRLITRLIFIWFMKEKKLIPNYLFEKNKIKEFLKDLPSEKSSYYKAILQNLFFATLNTPIKKRGFRDKKSHHGVNKDFMRHDIYRYEKYFKKPSKILSLFADIPFLNGGLFECLDKRMKGKNKKKYLRIDGFSDRKDNILKIPDSLFFSEERDVDLNSDYGTKKKKYKVRGLIDILQSYNFTVDENTPIDEEIALDPELLGLVFENLLANYNPETSSTARKATGSYYTPRKIVDYMVDESLKAYLKNKLTRVKKINIKLNNLFSYHEEDHQFNNNEVDVLIKAINKLKIIDPAVGSGAFPMGVLQKLVFVLSKIDPHNKKWKQEQINAVENNVSDVVLRKKLIKKIEFNFKNNNLDYGRKLYLIQNCIYGVDIQITAIQISKLRFFISLLVDEKSDKKMENFGIEPLPNLETKFVAANSLIGLQNDGQASFELSSITELKKELKKVRVKYFNANYKNEKEKLRKKDKEIRLQLAELFKQSGFPSENTEKIINWDPYSSNTSANFFDSEWMFGVNGFDIVIGNPPYVQLQKFSGQDIQKQYEKAGYQTFKKTGDIYVLFYEKGLELSKNNTGVLCYITSNKWLRAGYGESLRKYFSEKNPLQILDFGGFKVFKNVAVDTNILLIQNSDNKNKLQAVHFKNDYEKDVEIIEYFKNNAIELKNVSDDVWFIGSQAEIDLKKKIEEKGIPLKDWNVKIYRGIVTGFNEAFIINAKTKEKLCKKDPKSIEIIKPILRGRDIERYRYRFANKWIINTNFDLDISKFYLAIFKWLKRFEGKLKKRDDKGKNWWNLRACVYYHEFEKEKIVWGNISYKSSFCYSSPREYVNAPANILTSDNTNIKYLLGCMNSKVFNWEFSNLGIDLGKAFEWKKQYVEKIHILKISPKQQKPFIKLVDQILEKKKDNPDANIEDLEDKIDKMVYKLYGLTKEEIKIIENN